MNSLSALVSDIQRFSTGDGPGIRTTVFFQGCNLRCEWCHNPEAIPRAPVLLYYSERCTGCGLCAAACPEGAHTVGEAGHVFDRGRCALSGLCASVCPSGALQMSGKALALGEVLRVVLEDREFYEASGGGVTLSGGEPLLQPEFCAALAKECADRGVPVLVETAGNVAFSAFEAVLPFVSEFYFDLKGAFEDSGREKTGGSVELALQNMARLVESGAAVTARIPIIPGYNDSEEHCRAMAALLQKAGVRAVHLLPFHRMGSGKYRAMGAEYPYRDTKPPSAEQMAALLAVFAPDFDAKLDG